jgi:hypothetical protein
MTSDADRDTIGLTPEMQAVLTGIDQSQWFRTGQDAARFCMAYAIREKVPEGVASGTDTRWSAGNFDSTGEIAALLSVIYPTCKTPVRLMEHLVNEGMRLVAERLKVDGVTPADLLD